ncbi:hypothetical protein [uncultured Dubosiella sp.]|uniref:hypothetical protein n=2 Tax=uncultured Dubosiella sp. TaxID=1937011 RepID=UPI0025A57DA9|nr:hypothetical protein [uncultured Dubosiella sp.]
MKKNVDYKFMSEINAGIEKRKADRWAALIEKAESEAFAEAKIAFIVVYIAMLFLTFALETPH